MAGGVWHGEVFEVFAESSNKLNADKLKLFFCQIVEKWFGSRFLCSQDKFKYSNYKTHCILNGI